VRCVTVAMPTDGTPTSEHGATRQSNRRFLFAVRQTRAPCFYCHASNTVYASRRTVSLAPQCSRVAGTPARCRVRRALAAGESRDSATVRHRIKRSRLRQTQFADTPPPMPQVADLRPQRSERTHGVAVTCAPVDSDAGDGGCGLAGDGRTAARPQPVHIHLGVG
jgi:hypothetical protein